MNTVKHTFDDFCQSLGISREWLESPYGHLEIDEQTAWLPADELVVGGNLEICNCSLDCLPPRVVVGKMLTIKDCAFKEFPAFIEVFGNAEFTKTPFASVHEGCHFHKSISFSYCKIRQLPDHFHVVGNLYLTRCPIAKLPKCLVVDRILRIIGTKIRRIPKDCVCDVLNADNSHLEELPENWSVRALYLSRSRILQLPKGLQVCTLDISETAIREIRELSSKILLYASNSQLRQLPDGSSFEVLDLTNCPISQLPKGMKVTDQLYISHTKITRFPADSDIRGTVVARGSALATLPEQMVLKELDVRGSQVKRIPAGIVSRWIFHDPDVQVDAYKFSSKNGIELHRTGKYIVFGSSLSEVLEHKGNVWRCRDTATRKEHYLVTNGSGCYSQGETLQSARTNLLFKLNNLDTSHYRKLGMDDALPFEEACVCYRTITGACQSGTDEFVRTLKEVKDAYTIREIIQLTIGQFGHDVFKAFFDAA